MSWIVKCPNANFKLVILQIISLILNFGNCFIFPSHSTHVKSAVLIKLNCIISKYRRFPEIFAFSLLLSHCHQYPLPTHFFFFFTPCWLPKITLPHWPTLSETETQNENTLREMNTPISQWPLLFRKPFHGLSTRLISPPCLSNLHVCA